MNDGGSAGVQFRKGQELYYLSPTGDWPIPCPVRVNDILIVCQNYQLPLHRISHEDWINRPSNVLSMPAGFYFRRDLPFAQVWLFPIPDQDYEARVFFEFDPQDAVPVKRMTNPEFLAEVRALILQSKS